jgi:HEPN domain-containing protein
MLRRPTNDNDPADWLAFAAERLQAADILWTHGGLTATGVETLQESAERYLKGFLIANGWQLVKTHDLPRLVREAKAFDPAFASFDALARELTEDFFAQHYPGGDLTHVGENYEKMRQQVGELAGLIQQKLPKYFPQKSNN